MEKNWKLSSQTRAKFKDTRKSHRFSWLSVMILGKDRISLRHAVNTLKLYELIWDTINDERGSKTNASVLSRSSSKQDETYESTRQ